MEKVESKYIVVASSPAAGGSAPIWPANSAAAATASS